MESSVSDVDVSGEELFRRFLSGDNDAFEGIVSRYEDELSRFIYRTVCDYHEAKHLTIEAFGRLAVEGRKFTGQSSLKTYLFTIGKNLTLKHVKARKKHEHIPFDELADVLCDNAEAPHSYVERSENEKMLHQAMCELKEEYRAVLVLLYFEDMSYLQAGEAMGKSETQIKHLAHRAKAALRKKLENSDCGL